MIKMLLDTYVPMQKLTKAESTLINYKNNDFN